MAAYVLVHHRQAGLSGSRSGKVVVMLDNLIMRIYRKSETA